MQEAIERAEVILIIMNKCETVCQKRIAQYRIEQFVNIFKSVKDMSIASYRPGPFNLPDIMQILNQEVHGFLEEQYIKIYLLVIKKIKELLDYLQNNKGKGSKGEMDAYWAETIRKFIKNPSTKDTKAAPKIPDGSPIGMD